MLGVVPGPWPCRVGGDPRHRWRATAGLENHAGNVKGTVFLLALVTAASMMPVEKLPAASWQTALGLGFVFGRI